MELTTLFAGYTAAEGKAERTKTARQDDRCGISDTVGQLKECEYLLRKNETLFNMEDEEEMIDCRIYEREALLARYQYLLRQKIKAARALLNGPLPVKVIAERCGFPKLRTFYAAFRRETGISPGTLRNRRAFPDMGKTVL